MYYVTRLCHITFIAEDADCTENAEALENPSVDWNALVLNMQKKTNPCNSAS